MHVSFPIALLTFLRKCLFPPTADCRLPTADASPTSHESLTVPPAPPAAVCRLHGLAEMRISVIIPALNEEAAIEECLRSVAAAGSAETVVVDGGSRDQTRARARPHAAVIRAPRGRAVQMNRGAAHASGDILLFLHADSRLPSEAFTLLRRATRDPRVVGGTFSLQFDSAHPVLRFYASFTRLRPRLFHYGDQGIFVRRAIFEDLGGFAELPLMEDVDFLRRLARTGRVALLPASVTTSCRRFEANGIIRQQLLNAALVAAFHCGVPATYLSRWYDRSPSRKTEVARATAAEKLG